MNGGRQKEERQADRQADKLSYRGAPLLMITFNIYSGGRQNEILRFFSNNKIFVR